jgi:hypothetical protein
MKGESSVPEWRLEFLRKLVRELKIDLLNDRDLKGKFSVSILLSSKRVKKSNTKIYLNELYESLK